MSIGTIPKIIQLFETAQILSNDITVGANAEASTTVNVAKDGYTPIGLKQLQTNGGANAIVSGWRFDRNTIYFTVRNLTGTQRTIRVAYSVLYIKA